MKPSIDADGMPTTENESKLNGDEHDGMENQVSGSEDQANSFPYLAVFSCFLGGSEFY